MKLTRQLRNKVENATVRIIDRSGSRCCQGVLAPGGYIITAAHCAYVMFLGDDGCGLCDGSLALGYSPVGEIETREGKRLKVQPSAIDPFTDIAVLSALDWAETFDEEVAFDEFCNSTPAVSMFRGKLRRDMKTRELIPRWATDRSGELIATKGEYSKTIHSKPFKIYIPSHKGHWITGQAKQNQMQDAFGHLVIFDLDPPIEGGTSGSPVVNYKGELIGIVSNSGGISGSPMTDGSIPFLPLVLPGYLWRRISNQ